MKKRWISKFFFMTISFLLIVAGINFFIDPYQQYRQATFYKPYFADGLYMNPGLAKNYDYNSVIIGSSMTQNFVISNVEEILKFTKPVKLCILGASTHELRLTLDVVFKHKEVESILYGLDSYSMRGKSTRLVEAFPAYLYDEKYMNDYKYLLNIDILKKDALFLLYQKTEKDKPRLNFNTMYQWQHFYMNDFGRDKILKMWNTKKSNLNNSHQKSDYDIETLEKNFNYNLLPIFKDHPNTTFYIFYPPYTMYAYKGMLEKGWFEQMLLMKLRIFQSLRKYPNVKIFDFQIAKEITHNLDNYRDFTHYHQKINKWMLEQIRDNNYLVTKDNINEYVKDLKEQVKNYDVNKTLK